MLNSSVRASTVSRRCPRWLAFLVTTFPTPVTTSPAGLPERGCFGVGMISHSNRPSIAFVSARPGEDWIAVA